MTVLAFGSRLNEQSWISSIERLHERGAEKPVGDADSHLDIDMSNVGFADFVALGRLLHLIDSLARMGVSVTVRLPGEFSGGQRAEGNEALRLARQRVNCRLFLQQSGFESALLDGPWPDVVRVIGPAAPRADNGAHRPSDHVEAPTKPHRFRKIVPYRWIGQTQNATEARPAGIASLQVALHDVGLSTEDAEAIAKGVLAELMATSEDGQETVLVGAAVVRAEVYGSRADDFSTGLQEFLRSASKEKSTLVRIVVAHSGYDLVSALAPDVVRLGVVGSHPEAVEGSSAGSIRLFDAATSDEVLRTRARGLWKALRIIRRYQGRLLIAVDGTSISGVLSTTDDGSLVDGAPQYATPGVFVEGNIPIAPPGRLITRDRTTWWPGGSPAGGRPRLTCVGVTLSPGDGVAVDERREVADRLRTLPTQDLDGLVITVSASVGEDSPTDVEIEAALVQLRDAVTRAQSPAYVAIVFPAINRHLLTIAVEDLNLRQDQCAPDDGSEQAYSILVAAPPNQFHWLGGSGLTRSILLALVRAGGPTRIGDLTEIQVSEAEKVTAVRQIRERCGLIQMRANAMYLGLRPEDAVEAVAAELASRIGCSIAEAGLPGVEKGRFLTPSLRVATRWCDVGALLTHLGAERLAGFALASRVAARLSWPADGAPTLSILRVAKGPAELVATLASALTGADEYYDSVGGLRLDRSTGPADTSASVVLVTDIISNGSAVANAVAELAARDIAVVAAATVVDARPPENDDGRDRPFTNRDLPVVSLVAVDLDPPVDEVVEVVPIDPVLFRPEKGVRPSPQALIDQDYYIGALIRTNAARLGHIERVAGRHYTAYVDPTRLFHDDLWTRRVLPWVCTKITEAHRSAFGAGSTKTAACIVYPQGIPEDLGAVAEVLADSVRGIGLSVAGIVPVPRVDFESQWYFASTAPLPKPARHVIILDSSVESGRSIQQLIRVYAVAPVEAITAIVLLNGLRDLDALALQGVTKVRRYGGYPTSAGGELGTDIPVTVYFVARTAVTKMDSRDCAVCDLRQTYDSIPLLVPVPEHIEQHREWLVKSLEARSKRRAFEEAATDLLGTNISQEDCVAYLRWKFEVREAAFDTPRRRKLLARLEDARTDRWLRDSLVRLLAAEAHWLRSAPLRFPTVRTRLAELAASLVVDQSAALIDPVLRVQALMLLINTDVRRFVTHIRAIAAANRDSSLVVNHVLLEALRLVAGSRLPTPHSRESLTQRLMPRLIGIENDLRERERAGEIDDALTISDVRYIISHGRRTLQPVPTDPQGAWAVLRRYRQSVVEHNFDNEMWRLLATLGNLSRGYPPQNPDQVRRDWRVCIESLTLDVLPNVRLVRRVFLADRYTRRIGGDDAIRWERAINGEGPGDLDNIENRIVDLLADVEAGGQHASYSVERLDYDLRWWNRFFLATHAEPGRSTDGSFLTEIVNRCPVDVMSVAKGIFGPAECEFFEPQQNGEQRLRVFCTSDVLNDAFTQIRRNAEETHRVHPPGRQRFRLEAREVDAHRVEVVVLNDDSAPSNAGGGHGLESISTELRDFDATITPVPDPGPPFTYGIVLTLERWRMI